MGIWRRRKPKAWLQIAFMAMASLVSQATLRLGDRRQRPLPQTPSRPVILLDPEMPSRLRLSPGNITLYRRATLELVGGDKQRLEKLYGAEIEVITPEDVFLPELHLLPGEGALANSWLSGNIEGKPIVNGCLVTPLLPFKEHIRDIFSSAELSRYCSMHLIATDEGMDLNVTLLLPLEGQQEAYPITRTYPLQEKNLIDEDLPVIALWPNISDFNWKRYVVFAEDSSVGLTVDGFPDCQLHISREGQETVKYFYCERFPDLINVSNSGQFIGLIPVNPPPLTSKTASSLRIGMDFGISFTNFLVDEGSGPVRKSLETRVIPLTLARREFQLNLLYKYFIPETLLPKNVNPPISTALNTYGWRETRGSVPKLFHQARVQWPSSNADSLSGPSARMGFTWRQLQYLRPFLKELALLISCNAAVAGFTSVEWAVSYPNTFIPSEARNYRREWDIICSEVADFSGLQQRFNGADETSAFQPDAFALAGYFHNILARQMVHTACVKVGRNSTDISIWQDNTLVHQVSVPFAGRDICTKILQSKPSFIRFLFPPSLTGIDFEESRQDLNFNSWLDLCLRFGSQVLLSDRLPIHRAEQNKQLLGFVSLMAISFGGLYHYLGLILKALAKEGRLQKQAAMPVYIGGNGARFLHWLDESGVFSKGCDGDLLFDTLQLQSTGFASASKGLAGTTLSQAFGDEIACGLISTGMNLLGSFDPRDEAMIAGEQLIINGLVFDSLDRVSLPPEMNSVESVAICSLNELKQFVQNYEEVVTTLSINTLLPIRKLAKMDSLWDDVETEVRAICLDRINRDLSDLEPEPGFIIGLRALTTTLARKWAEEY
jgi:hypothetical protein